MATIKKMADYGLKLADADAQKLADYFVQKLPINRPIASSRYVELSADTSTLIPPLATPRTDPKRGKQLFSTYCQSCHGAKGEGLVGPHLKDRRLTDANYWSTVTYGKRQMPAFKGQLTLKQLSDIKAWLGTKKL
jgi:mono/diheme cytochrome c family protein